MNKYELKEYKYQVSRTLLPLREELWDSIDARQYPVRTIELDDGCFRVQIDLSADFFIEIALEYTHRENLQFFFHFCQWVSFDGNNPQVEEIPLKRDLVTESVIHLGKYKNGKYLLNATKTFSTKVCELINKLILHKVELLKACEESTNYNPDGTHKKVFKSWKSKAIITKVYKSQGIVRSIQGISKARQNFFDKLPTLHGSNGSYVENAPYEWFMDVRIKRMCYEIDESMWQTVNIHDYITTQLMPRLDWGLITPDRLDWIKSVLEQQRLNVETYQMNKAPIYREFMPLDYNHSWYEYLDHIISSTNI